MGDKHKKSHSKENRHPLLEKAKEFYVKEYRKLFLLLVGLAVLSAFALAINYFQTGDFIKRDVTLKGGVSITIHAGVNTFELESFLNSRFPGSSLNIRTLESGGGIAGVIVEASDIPEDELLAAIRQKVKLDNSNYSTESMGSSLGESFFSQMFIALLIAFIGMGIVFQFYFRNIYGTAAALFSVLLDIFITFGIMTFLGVRLTAGGIAAYLMLIGYSIDTSILLSTKLLKESHADKDKAIFSAMKTGLTMSAAGLAAMGISFILTNNTTLKQIMLIIVIGLIVDVLTTWVGNVTFLRMYLDKKHGKA